MTCKVKIVAPYDTDVIRDKKLIFLKEEAGHFFYEHYAPDGNIIVRKGGECGVTRHFDLLDALEELNNAN